MKLRKIVKVGATVQYEQSYLGGLEYRKNGTGSTRVEAVYHAEGRYLNLNAEVNNTLLWQKEYTLKDHLGNARISFTDKNANGIVDVPSDIVQENHYYPFGLNYEGAWRMNDVVAKDSRYLYNNKELSDDFGLNLYAYGARYYDAAIGRFTGVDPIADQFPELSVYNYASNKPVNGIDLHGLQWAPPKKMNGAIDADAATYNYTSREHRDVVIDAVLDEIPVVGEVKSYQEGGLVEVIIGAAVGGWILKKVWRAVNKSGADDIINDLPSEPYNRKKHYGSTPTKKDRKDLGASGDEVVDHDPPLVKRYYQGDPKTGEKPGYKMNPEERKASAKDKNRMKTQSKDESNKQGGEMSKYSKEQKKKWWGNGN